MQNVSVGSLNLIIPYGTPECKESNTARSSFPNYATLDNLYKLVHFWYRETLNISGSLTDLGGVQIEMLLVLVLAWVMIFWSMQNGSEAAGAKLYFIAFCPYIVLVIFLVAGSVQEGGIEGLKILLTPDWQLLQAADIWIDASSQIFYSFGVCFGVIIDMVRHNNIHVIINSK